MRCKLVVAVVFAAAVVAAVGLMEWSHVRSLLGLPAPAALSAKTEAEGRVLAVLDEMRRSGKTYQSVGEQSGRMLRLLTEAVGAKHVVEIGTSTGYSGLWFCLALQTTGGRLTTFEISPSRAAMAREHFKEAGVDRLVTVVEGDAHQTLAQLQGPLDVVFIDADKGGYPDYLNKLLPLVRPGGLILADNVNMSAAYYRAITSNPALETLFYSEGGSLGITLKKR